MTGRVSGRRGQSINFREAARVAQWACHQLKHEQSTPDVGHGRLKAIQRRDCGYRVRLRVRALGGPSKGALLRSESGSPICLCLCVCFDFSGFPCYTIVRRSALFETNERVRVISYQWRTTMNNGLGKTAASPDGEGEGQQGKIECRRPGLFPLG